MAKKFKVNNPACLAKGGKYTSPPLTQSVSTNSEHPIFCLKLLSRDSDYCLDDCDKDEKSALIDTLAKLSKMTWGEIQSSPRHGSGHEVIPKARIRATVPDHIDSELLSFRFCGKAPFVGYREGVIFHILWIDRKFKLYDHGP